MRPTERDPCRRWQDRSLVQVYTVARRPAESFVTPLPDNEVDAIANLVTERTGIPALPFYGMSG
ncbi:MAG: hypothetical protein U0894_13215 [Pirellulales bacterium]